jgi:hypothetical protein
VPVQQAVCIDFSRFLAFAHAQACVQRNFLNIVTIALGFIVQASLMVLIFFK